MICRFRIPLKIIESIGKYKVGRIEKHKGTGTEKNPIHLGHNCTQNETKRTFTHLLGVSVSTASLEFQSHLQSFNPPARTPEFHGRARFALLFSRPPPTAVALLTEPSTARVRNSLANRRIPSESGVLLTHWSAWNVVTK